MIGESSSTCTTEVDRSKTTVDGLDKGIMSLPQIQYIESLIARLTDPDASLIEKQRFNLIEEGKFAFDIIIENERGSMFFGIPLFSHNSLIVPVDPPSYQTLHGNPINDLHLYPLPDLHWKWSWPSWSILMIGDVDEQGFVYSRVRFNSKRWKGVYKFGNFVRRRIWIRKRERISSKDVSQIYKVPGMTGTFASLVEDLTPTTTAGMSMNTSFTSIPITENDVQKLKKRERLKNRMKRRKDTGLGEQIEFLNNDDVLLRPTSFVPSYDSSGTSDEEEIEVNSESLIEDMVLEVEGLKLDRLKIEAFINFIDSLDPTKLTEVLHLLGYKYIGRLINSLDHPTSCKLLTTKLEEFAISKNVVPQIRNIIASIEMKDNM